MLRRKGLTMLSGIFLALTVSVIAFPGCKPSGTPTAIARLPTETLPPPSVTLIVNPKITEISAGQSVALTVETSGQDLRFEWSSARGHLSAFDTPAIIYTAPDSAGMDTVTVKVSSASGTTTKNVSFNVIAPPTATFTPTSTLTPTLIPTPTATPLPPSPAVTVTVPLTKVECPLNDECRFSVKGTSSDVASDPNLTMLVFVNHPYQPDQWWPHRGFSVKSDGAWEGKAQIGDRPCFPAGHYFEIVAVVMTREQANRIAMDFQSLPREYVAQSNFVDLVTTYSPVPISLLSASTGHDTGSSIALSTKEQTSLAFDYDLGTGNWVQVIVPMVPVAQDMSCMKELGFSISFSFQGTGQANSLEVKLEDIDTNYGWLSSSGANVMANAETIQLPLDGFVYWWGDEDMNWKQIKNVVFSVARKQPGDKGGAGDLAISDVVLAPPAAP